MLERMRTTFATLPQVMRIGLLIVLAGGMLDMVYHSLPLPWATMADLYLGHDGWSLHMLVLLGMITTLAGMIADRIPVLAHRAQRAETERRPPIKR